MKQADRDMLERLVESAPDHELLAALAMRGAKTRRQASGKVKVQMWLEPRTKSSSPQPRRRRSRFPSENSTNPHLD